jgi:hypothetical protein
VKASKKQEQTYASLKEALAYLARDSRHTRTLNTIHPLSFNNHRISTLSLASPLIRACLSITTSHPAMAPKKRKLSDGVSTSSAKRQKGTKAVKTRPADVAAERAASDAMYVSEKYMTRDMFRLLTLPERH